VAVRSTAARTVVGLDVEPGFAAAVRVRVGGAVGVAIERAAGVPLGPGVVHDGEVADAEALTEALRLLFRSKGLGRRVRIGVANQRIVVRTFDLPPLESPKEIAAAVRFHAQDHIPMPLDQAVLEHQSLGIAETPDGPRTRVVLVAARRDMVERLHGAVRRAGLRPEGIDLSAFAMIRALHRGEEPAVYLSVGGVTNLALGQGTTCLFTRAAPGGVEALAAELAERRELTLEHARQWLDHVGLAVPAETIEGDPSIVHAARTVLEEGVRRIADEVRTTLDYHAAQAATAPAARAIVTGPATAIPGFVAALGAAIGLPAEVGVVGEARPGAHNGIAPGRLAVAAGLALRDAPPRAAADPAPVAPAPVAPAAGAAGASAAPAPATAAFPAVPDVPAPAESAPTGAFAPGAAFAGAPVEPAPVDPAWPHPADPPQSAPEVPAP
jgi:type IV pilus assembly protein PilM